MWLQNISPTALEKFSRTLFLPRNRCIFEHMVLIGGEEGCIDIQTLALKSHFE